jgi:hypothetical protein
MLGERYEFRIQRLNLLVEPSPFVSQFQDQALDARRQNVVASGNKVIKSTFELHALGREHHTSFQNNCAELIDQGRALSNQA